MVKAGSILHPSVFQTLQITSPHKPLGQSKPNLIWSCHGPRETKVCLPHLGHMTKMAAMPIYGKNPLKIIFSRTKGPMALGLGMQYWGYGPNKVRKKL